MKHKEPIMNHTSKSLGADVSRVAEDALQATNHALEATRELASQAIERAGEKARDVRNSAKDAGAAAQRQLSEYAKATGRYVSNRPLTSALIAAALGAAVAALALAMLRSKDHD